MDDKTKLGNVDFRGEVVDFGIYDQDRKTHMYIIGKSGTGKTTFLENMCMSDILKGYGVCFIDPHGEISEELLKSIPEERIQDVVYFNPFDIEYPISFNIMENVDFDKRYNVAGNLVAVFKKIWPDVWSGRMLEILTNTILALLEFPDSTLFHIPKFWSDEKYRAYLVSKLKDSTIKNWWTEQFAKWSDNYRTEAVAAVNNKIGQFVSNPLIRNIVGQSKSSLDLRKIMDEKKILIINLSIGLLGEENSALLGALLITKIQMASMSRADIDFEDRHPFYFYIDEFQNFSTESFAKTLSESRKYNLRLILAHQYINQLDVNVKDAIFGNIANMIAFRVGPNDAMFLSNEFYPIGINDFVNLPNFKFYIKMLINGEPKKPFLANALLPYVKPEVSFVDQIVENTRNLYSTQKQNIDEKLKKFNNMVYTNITERPVYQTEFWKARCSVCGKTVMVPFKPDDKRPVYCEKCFVKNKGRHLPTINNDIVKPEISRKPKFKKEGNEDKNVTNMLKNILKK